MELHLHQLKGIGFFLVGIGKACKGHIVLTNDYNYWRLLITNDVTVHTVLWVVTQI